MDTILANIFSFTGNQPQKSPLPHLLHPSPPSKQVKENSDNDWQEAYAHASLLLSYQSLY
eukprot:scaffold423_cov185-Ochromonas_danica.AAC.17